MTNQNQNQNHTEYIQLPNENAAGGSPLDALAVPTPAESDAEKTGTLDDHTDIGAQVLDSDKVERLESDLNWRSGLPPLDHD